MLLHELDQRSSSSRSTVLESSREVDVELGGVCSLGCSVGSERSGGKRSWRGVSVNGEGFFEVGEGQSEGVDGEGRTTYQGEGGGQRRGKEGVSRHAIEEGE